MAKDGSNDLDMTRGVRVGAFAGVSARVRVMHEGGGRKAGWVASLEGLDIQHTFSRTFQRPVRQSRAWAPIEKTFLLQDGLYEANSARAQRVVFEVREGAVRRMSVQAMIELLREREGVTYGDVRAHVSARRLRQARTAAMALVNPDERAAAYQMILGAQLGGAMRRPLTRIDGTEEQIAWCNDLRASAFHTLGNALFERMQYSAEREHIAELAAALAARADARWWINNRKSLKDYRDLKRALAV